MTAARTDTVVLACTHYPLLIERLRQLAPWPVNFIDPAPAIARRVVDLLGRRATPAGPPGSATAIFTSGRPGARTCADPSAGSTRGLTLRGVSP